MFCKVIFQAFPTSHSDLINSPFSRSHVSHFSHVLCEFSVSGITKRLFTLPLRNHC